MKMPDDKTPEDRGPTFSRNADGTRVIDPRMSFGIDHRAMEEAARRGEVLLVFNAHARPMPRTMRIEHRIDDFVFVATFTDRKRKARNEKRLARGYRPRHVRASV